MSILVRMLTSVYSIQGRIELDVESKSVQVQSSDQEDPVIINLTTEQVEEVRPYCQILTSSDGSTIDNPDYSPNGRYIKDNSKTGKKFSVLRAVQGLEMDCDIDECTDVNHVDRDSKDHVTIYGTETGGQLWYLILSQELIEELKTI